MTLVNNSYPLEYFALLNLEQSVPDNPFAFWASEEALAPSIETLDFDFGTVRPVNYLDFEIGRKPISVLVYSWNDIDLVWEEVTLRDDTESILDFTYDSSVANPWSHGEAHFEAVETQFIRLEFTRETTSFPFSDSEAFPWSIEIRNLRLVHIIATEDDFLEDASFDIFGNPQRTELVSYGPEATHDGDDGSYWQSQPNPSPAAVECLYFDLRVSDDEDLPVVIDEVYLEPLTPGVVMHIYVSNDTVGSGRTRGGDSRADIIDNGWDYKLWTPIPRHYVVTQGHHALPIPTACKYVKLEFTKLSAIPFNTLDYPPPPPVVYRQHPTWIQNEIKQLFPVTSADSFSSPFDLVTVDPLSLGFQVPLDGMDSALANTRFTPEVALESDTDPSQLQGFIGQTTEETAAQTDKTQVENQIRFVSPEIYQADLSRVLDPGFAHSRLLLNGINQTDSNTNPYMSEIPLANLPETDTQSVADVSPARIEKLAPITWFPRVCRHQYQYVSSPRPRKVAYYVAIKTVSFVRRDYDAAVAYDFDHYLELLDDDHNLEYNDLTQDPEAPWRYI